MGLQCHVIQSLSTFLLQGAQGQTGLRGQPGPPGLQVRQTCAFSIITGTYPNRDLPLLCCMMRGQIKGTDSTIISIQGNAVLYKS